MSNVETDYLARWEQEQLDAAHQIYAKLLRKLDPERREARIKKLIKDASGIALNDNKS